MNLLEEINKIVPDSTKVAIKDLVAKFNALPTEPVVAPVISAPTNLAAIETKLKDGTTLSVDKMEVGGKAQLITEAGVVDAPDAEYEAEDGTKIYVTGGLISKIEPVMSAPVVTPDNGMPAMMAALTARLDAIETKFAKNEAEKLSLKTEMASLNDATKITLSAVNLILSTPAGEPIEKPVKIINKQMSALSSIADSKKQTSQK